MRNEYCVVIKKDVVVSNSRKVCYEICDETFCPLFEKIYVMEDHILKRLKTMRNKNEIVCHSPHCDKPIQSGDLVISKPSMKSKSSRVNNIWHLECLKATVVA